MKRPHWLLATGLLICLAGLPACGGDDGRAPDLPVAKFEPGPCPTKKVEPEVTEVLKDARCGTLVIPANRNTSAERTVRNAVVIMPAKAKQPASDPIVYVHGGPGGSAILEAAELVNAGLNRDRDLILMSQRGNIHSEPALTCEEIDRFNARVVSIGTDAPEAESLRAEAVQACRNRLLAAGVDLSDYNTAESAADLDDLRTALEIPKWNLLGHSYGTQLALTYMGEYPDAIRAVVLDGVVPPTKASFGLLWRATGEGFRNLVAACEAQPDCRSAYPDVGETFERLVREAASDPVTTTVTATDGQQVKVVLDASTLVSWLVTASHMAADAPATIHKLAQGDPRRIAEQWALPKLNAEGFDVFSWGLLNSTTCAEWEQGEEEEIGEGREAFPALPSSVWRNVPQVPFHHRVDCVIWDVPAAPASLRESNKSDIPTLVLSGSFDAQTAASNGAVVAETLSKAIVKTIPYAAHGTFFESECSADLITAFIDDPDPRVLDTTCVGKAEPPKFNVE